LHEQPCPGLGNGELDLSLAGIRIAVNAVALVAPQLIGEVLRVEHRFAALPNKEEQLDRQLLGLERKQEVNIRMA
jgi:hypothetical protein